MSEQTPEASTYESEFTRPPHTVLSEVVLDGVQYRTIQVNDEVFKFSWPVEHSFASHEERQENE